jgi:TPR repeat protein
VINRLKAIITKENIIIKDFHLHDDNKDNIQSSNNHQPNSNVEISEKLNSLHGDLSQIIQNFSMMNTNEATSSSNQIDNSLNIIINDIINFVDDKDNKIGKQKVLDYLNNHNITLQEINNLLLNIQNNSNSIVLLGKFNYLGIGIDIDKKKAFELYQKAANLEYANGINNLGDCYQNGIGTGINKKKAFELYQKAANLGNANGINNLGYCYEIGIGTYIDKKMSFELYQKAAYLGNSTAQFNLALMYEN